MNRFWEGVSRLRQGGKQGLRALTMPASQGWLGTLDVTGRSPSNHPLFKNRYIYLAMLGFSCSMWDLVP